MNFDGEQRAQQVKPAALIGVEIVLNIQNLTKPYGLICPDRNEI